MVEKVTGGVNVLDADEVEVKALARECEKHGNENQKQGLLWGEVERLSGECFGLTHTRTRRRTIALGRDGSCGEMAFARIGRGDDDADGFLVEAFEATVALEVFEMAADCTLGHEFLHLFLGDEA